MTSQRKSSHTKLTRVASRATHLPEQSRQTGTLSLPETVAAATTSSIAEVAQAAEGVAERLMGSHVTSGARNLGTGLLAAAARGLVATATMSATMSAAKAVGLLGEPPPHKIVRKTLRRANVHPSKKTSAALSVAAHFAFGASLGVAHALLLRSHKRSLTAGLLFGAGVWGLSYGGLIPAAGIMATPPHDKPGRPTAMLVSHLVFGSTLAAASALGNT